jgi:hypothetical protein
MESILITSQNVNGIYSNLSRAYEIALLGGFAIKLSTVENADSVEVSEKDMKFITGFFPNVKFYYPSDNNKDIPFINTVLYVELNKPHFENISAGLRNGRKTETLQDIVSRVESAKSNITPEFKPNEAGWTLFKTGYERLDLDVITCEYIAKTSQIIAKLHGSKDIKVEYIAEAMQYQTCSIK